MYIPEVIYIETTNKCNAKCVMCPHNNMQRESITMTDELFQLALNRCVELSPRHAQIFLHKEGEPLLDKKIAQRIALMKGKLGDNNEIGLNTNAMLLSDEIAEQLIRSGLDVIYFSVDGIDKKTYESIRIGLDYDTVKKNIEKFFSLKEKYHSNIRVIMQMLTTNDYNDNVESFKKIWSKFPCEFYIKRMHSYLDGGHSSLTKKLSTHQVKICEDIFKIIVIYVDGNVGLCCWDYNNEYCIGNIRTDSLSNIYNNQKANYLRKLLLEGRGNLVTPCNRCARIFGEDAITKPNGEDYAR